MTARVVNLVIPQGADYSNLFLLEDSNNTAINLADYNGVCHIKKHPTSRTSVGLAVSFPSPPYGQVRVSLGSTLTSTIKPGKYVYDLLLTDGNGTKTRVVEGIVTVTAGVSTT